MKDSDIIQLYLNRDTAAISETAAKYNPYCMKIACSILENREDAEECTNDTWLRAWNSIPPQIPQILSAFLGRITRNLSFDRYRSKMRSKRGNGEITLVLDELSQCISGNDDIERLLRKRELTDALNRFLGQLDSRKRIIFVRRYWYNDSISDIADSLNISAGKTSSILHRLRKKLKEHLEKEEIAI